MIAILIVVRSYFIAVWIYISLKIIHIEHFFMCLLALCISSLEKNKSIHVFFSCFNKIVFSY